MERITVNMSPTAMLETCHASQFDVGVQKRFDLVDGSSAYTLTGAETITLKIRTPDGTLVESNVPNTSDSYVIWTSEAGELDAFGICLCSIHVTNGSDELGSGNFIMEVEADPYNGKNIRIVTVGPADICTFETTLPEPYQSVTVNVLATGGYDADTQTAHPINGYSSANITRCGKNLINNDNAEIGTAWNGSPNSARARLVIPCEPSTNYVLSMNGTMTVDGVYSGESETIPPSGIGAVTFPKIFTTANTSKYITLGFNKTSITQEDIDGLKLQLEKSSSATAYAPYNGQTYTIAFGQTVYGGVLDVTRGKLHVTHGIASFDGTEYYILYTQTVVCGKTFAVGTGTFTDMLCSHSAFNQIGYATSQKQTFEFRNLTSTWGCADLNAFKTFVATQYANGTPLTILYPLETPFDIDLTPVQIRALMVNNVFADCGETEVEYLYLE